MTQMAQFKLKLNRDDCISRKCKSQSQTLSAIQKQKTQVQWCKCHACAYFLMCARAMLLSNTILDMLSIVPRPFISESTSWIPATSPWLPRTWISLVMASCEGIWFSSSIDLSFSRASVEECKRWVCVWDMSVCVCVSLTFRLALLAVCDDDQTVGNITQHEAWHAWRRTERHKHVLSYQRTTTHFSCETICWGWFS